MAKKLKIDFTVDVDGEEFSDLGAIDVSASDFYTATKTYLKDITGINDFETSENVKFKGVGQDLDNVT